MDLFSVSRMTKMSSGFRAFTLAAPIASTVAFVFTAFWNFLGGQDADKLEWGEC